MLTLEHDYLTVKVELSQADEPLRLIRHAKGRLVTNVRQLPLNIVVSGDVDRFSVCGTWSMDADAILRACNASVITFGGTTMAWEPPILPCTVIDRRELVPVNKSFFEKEWNLTDEEASFALTRIESQLGNSAIFGLFGRARVEASGGSANLLINEMCGLPVGSEPISLGMFLERPLVDTFSLLAWRFVHLVPAQR